LRDARSSAGFGVCAVPGRRRAIIDPVLLSGIGNVFRVELNYLDPESKLPAGDASKAVVITHVVIDDQPIDRL